MPQEAWVLKCYSCKKFQVQLKKKAKKWQCKVCGAKQDLMTIFFKGQPSDCRINVQNLSAAEGEKFEILQAQTTNQSDDYNYDECENIPYNPQNENYFDSQNEENEELNEDAMRELDEQCNYVEEKYSQEISRLDDDYVDPSENISQEYSKTVETQSYITNEQRTSNSEENVYDVNSTDFIIKTFNNKVNNSVKNHNVPKLSIFESNSEFDESLDF